MSSNSWSDWLKIIIFHITRYIVQILNTRNDVYMNFNKHQKFGSLLADSIFRLQVFFWEGWIFITGTGAHVTNIMINKHPTFSSSEALGIECNWSNANYILSRSLDGWGVDISLKSWFFFCHVALLFNGVNVAIMEGEQWKALKAVRTDIF